LTHRPCQPFAIIEAEEAIPLRDFDRLFEKAAYLWSSTTHLEAPPGPQEADRPFTQTGELAIYAAIGPAVGYMELPPGSGQRRWVDVHGAGAMRSDPKAAATNSAPRGFGPQHDDVRGRNLSLCVRSAKP
jgi:hypothetical protein